VFGIDSNRIYYIAEYDWAIPCQSNKSISTPNTI
jgi:hypothetical protein